MSRFDTRAVEIGADDATWLRGELPTGVELEELDEVEFWNRTYDRAPGSALYLPTEVDARERAVTRALARAEPMATPIGISLFTGCGGFDLGMHEAGFDVVAANEWDAPAATTYLMNLAHPGCEIHFASDKDRRRWEKNRERAMARKKKRNMDGQPDMAEQWLGTGYREASGMKGGCRAFFFGDIAHLTGVQMMDAAGVDAVDVLFGGPPCQGLSTANAKACLEDPRNALLWEYMRMVAEIKPRSFIIENVPGLLHVARGALFNAIAQLANDAGYNVVATKLNAVEFGVPQYRLRAIVVGTREGEREYRYPMPTHWAMGRPINDKGWQIGDEIDRVVARVPSQAKYDPIARRWSFNNAEQPTPQSEPNVQAEELSLFGDCGAA